MKMRMFAVLLPLLLAACGGGTGDAVTAPANSVAAATAPAGQSWIDTVARTDGGYRLGNPDAALKLVEYGARSCPTCGAFGREGMRPLEETYVASGKVSYEFRDFLVHGAPDLPGALLGACAGPGPFFALLEGMYVNQNDYLDRIQKIDQARLQNAPAAQVPTILAEAGGMIDFVKERGIPEAKARACLSDPKALEALAQSTDKWSQDGTVTGTPTFYLNGEKVSAADWKGVEAALKAAGA